VSRLPPRRVEPVRDEFDPGELFDPSSQARPLLALSLTAGPVLAIVGVLGWVRLLLGVPLHPAPPVDLSGLALDAALLLLFCLSHSLLARGFGRKWLNRPLGPGAEMPLYVLVSGLSLTLLAFGWRDSGPLLWDLEGLPRLLCRGVQAAGALLALWGTLVLGAGRTLGLSHLDALRRGLQPPAPEFVALPPYRFVRHPVSLGLLALLLAQHEATLDRLLLGAGMALWILLATPFEERDAEITFGQVYREYKRRTPRWLPRPPRREDPA